jgi:hypothetical protein
VAAAGSVASAEDKIGQAWLMRRRPRRVSVSWSNFAGFRFPPDVIMVAVRWYWRYGLAGTEPCKSRPGWHLNLTTAHRPTLPELLLD